MGLKINVEDLISKNEEFKSEYGGTPTIRKYRGNIRITNEKYDFILYDFPYIYMTSYWNFDKVARAMKVELPNIEQLHIIRDNIELINSSLSYFNEIDKRELLLSSDIINSCHSVIGMRTGQLELDDSGLLLGNLVIRFIKNIKR